MILVPDEEHFRGRFPWVTWCLIATNFLVFYVQLAVGEPFNYGYSLIPEEITSGNDLVTPQLARRNTPPPDSGRGKGRAPNNRLVLFAPVPQHPGPVPIQLTLVTSMFMHAGWAHLLGNMWFLFIFGSLIERRLGWGLFLVFYLACGVAAGFTHVLVSPHSVIPYVGASGAISGVMGAYLWLKPLDKIRVWVVVVLEVPALVGLPVWVALQLASSAEAITSGQIHGGVAYWAHVGGFAFGLLYLLVLVLLFKALAVLLALLAAVVPRRPASAAPPAEAAPRIKYTPLDNRHLGPDDAYHPCR
jgi:membrane associated rhomboid family serine protease